MTLVYRARSRPDVCHVEICELDPPVIPFYDVNPAYPFTVAVSGSGVELAWAAPVAVTCVKVIGAHLPFCPWLHGTLAGTELFLLFYNSNIFNVVMLLYRRDDSAEQDSF